MIVLMRLKHVKQALRMAQLADSFFSSARQFVNLYSWCCRGYAILHTAGFEGDNTTIELPRDFNVVLPDKDAKNHAGEDAWKCFEKRIKAPEGFGAQFRELSGGTEFSQ